MTDARGIAIREASSADHLLLAEIQQEASVAGLAHIFPPADHPFPADEVRERWQTFEGRTFVAMLDGRTAGFVGVVGPSLEGLYVIPDAWGTGVAAALHDAALDAIRATGFDLAQLWVLEHNARARRFYERRGWRPDGRTRVVEFPPHPTDIGYSVPIMPLGPRG